MSNSGLQQLQRSAVIDFAHALVSVWLNRQLHDRNSQHCTDALRDLTQRLATAGGMGIESPLQLQFDGTCIYHDGYPLEGPSLQAKSLLQSCQERRIGMLSFRSELSADEANRLVDLLLLPENRDALYREHRDATLTALGIRNVRVTLRDPGDPTNRREHVDGRGSALRHYQDLAEALQQNHQLAHRDLELRVDATASAVERTLQEIEEPSMLLSLSMQDDVDRFTVGHSVRVALLALQVARAAGADRDQLVRVGAAALLHDIGKSKVPQEILFKQGRLLPEEWEWMAQHPRLGAQILIEQHESVDPNTIGAAFCHHMGPNGKGYPDSMLPVPPSATSRLIRVCDVFEALTAVRPYKHALTPIEAYAVMFRNSSDFDPDWLQNFVRTLGLFPNGTRVELQDGAQALVIAQSHDIRKPELRLLTAAAGGTLPADHPPTVRCGESLHGETVRIAQLQTHERIVALPELDPEDPEAAQAARQTVHDTCIGHDHDEDDHGDGDGHKHP
ncbi:MAG: HD-GYP domain-containing protein [Planctomycetota bacterium]